MWVMTVYNFILIWKSKFPRVPRQYRQYQVIRRLWEITCFLRFLSNLFCMNLKKYQWEYKSKHDLYYFVSISWVLITSPQRKIKE
jgi:hypothetical protein